MRRGSNRPTNRLYSRPCSKVGWRNLLYLHRKTDLTDFPTLFHFAGKMPKRGAGGGGISVSLSTHSKSVRSVKSEKMCSYGVLGATDLLPTLPTLRPCFLGEGVPASAHHAFVSAKKGAAVVLRGALPAISPDLLTSNQPVLPSKPLVLQHPRSRNPRLGR